MTKVHAENEENKSIKEGGEEDDELLQWLASSKIRHLDLFLIGVTIVIGGQMTQFNQSFAAGYSISISNTLFTGFGYLCLSFCMAEMSSALPFSGGVYGFVRAFIHPWLGFLVSFFELALNVMYVAGAVYALARVSVSLVFQEDDEQIRDNEAPAIFTISIIIYVIINVICILGGKVFWGFNMILSFLVLALLFIYMFGSLPNVDFNKYAISDQVVNTHTLFSYLAPASCSYLGIQYLPLLSKDVENPRKTIPRVMVSSVLFFMLTSVGLITISCSQEPGITHLAGSSFPLSYGFHKIFNMSLEKAAWLSVPGLFAIAFGFTFSYARQSLSMAESHFLPKFFAYKTPYTGTPYCGLLFASAFCLVIEIFIHYDDTFFSLLYNLSLLSAYFVFNSACVAYIVFYYTYTTVAREFRSPLGIYGAICAILIFTFCTAGIVGFDLEALVIVGIDVVFGTIVYFSYVAQHQVFSKEEQDNLFKAYVINANIAKKNQKKATAHHNHRTQQHQNQHQTVRKSEKDKQDEGKAASTVVHQTV